MNDRADGLLGGFVVLDEGDGQAAAGNGQELDDGQRMPPIGREYYTILQVLT
jgi:hypothetical protein